jgi:hypothetical protein
MEASNLRRTKLLLLTVFAVLSFAATTFAQPASLASLPEADVLIYLSPQRILNRRTSKKCAAASRR